MSDMRSGADTIALTANLTATGIVSGEHWRTSAARDIVVTCTNAQ